MISRFQKIVFWVLWSIGFAAFIYYVLAKFGPLKSYVAAALGIAAGPLYHLFELLTNWAFSRREMGEVEASMRKIVRVEASLSKEIGRVEASFNREVSETKASLGREISETKASLSKEIGEVKGTMQELQNTLD